MTVIKTLITNKIIPVKKNCRKKQNNFFIFKNNTKLQSLINCKCIRYIFGIIVGFV